MTRKELYRIFDTAPAPKKEWEHGSWDKPYDETGKIIDRGLLLRGCRSCGAMETRETYVKGFWAEVHELRTGMSCDIIYRCKCGSWHADCT